MFFFFFLNTKLPILLITYNAITLQTDFKASIKEEPLQGPRTHEVIVSEPFPVWYLFVRYVAVRFYLASQPQQTYSKNFHSA